MMLTTMTMMILAQSNPATTPVDRLGEDWWKQRHEACVARTKAADFDVAFLGDSITQGWEGGGKALWDSQIAPLKAANFGFSGDRTEHVLWRLDNGELVDAKPKLIVMMIGTNNVGHGSSTPAQAVEGIQAIVNKLMEKSPMSKLLILSTFPRGATTNDDMRMKVAQIVAGTRMMSNDKHVFVLDLGPKFISKDGTIQTAIMPDLLHLSGAGYQIWADNMMPEIKRLLALP
jgi:lysophospholipase L1-like esterase